MTGIVEVTASAGAHFACEQADERETRPLAKTKRTKQLLFGVLECGSYGIDSGDRHEAPREGDAMKVNCQAGAVKEYSSKKRQK
jgi:hypothetical protein